MGTILNIVNKTHLDVSNLILYLKYTKNNFTLKHWSTEIHNTSQYINQQTGANPKIWLEVNWHQKIFCIKKEKIPNSRIKFEQKKKKKTPPPKKILKKKKKKKKKK